ncbi:MAG TPA: S8/S53 family peptidase, partial [Anaerolineales bacterium]|nr:S8/S53 family peptidase [Anaerolineales bacterium]
MNAMNKDKKQPTPYFMPGEVVLQVRHPEVKQDELPDPQEDPRLTILNAVKGFLQPSDQDKQAGDKASLSDQGWRSRLVPPATVDKMMTVPVPDSSGRIFSLMPVRLSGYNTQASMDPDEVISILREAHADVENNGSPDLGRNASLQAIFPNWLTSTLHHGPPIGGPGSWPLPAAVPAKEKHRFLGDNALTGLLPQSLLAIHETRPRVVILDTAPSPQELARAYHEYPEHEILKTMLGPNGKLKVYHATQETLLDLMHFGPASHQYWMPDHGLFVAGIIHTIACDVELHLYEVLGPYGVGSFTSVAQGLLDAIEQRGNHSLIINCSFMFDIPQAPVPGLDLPPALQEASIKSISDVFAWATSREKVHVIAAAGNDAESSESRPKARFPAA